MKRTFLLATLLLAACGGGAPDIEVTDAWARETLGGSTAAYMTIANRGTGPDRLVEVTVPPPAAASLHGTTMEQGVSRMRPLEGGVAVPAGGHVNLRSGGIHVMVTGLDEPLRPGETLRLTLRFARSGERKVEAEVRPALAPTPMTMNN